MPILSNPLIRPDNDEYYEALVKRQTKKNENHDTCRYYDFIPIGSTVAVQQEDGGLWTHGTVVGKANYNHNNRSYTIFITRTD